MQANQNPQNQQQRITRATSCSFQNNYNGARTDSKVELLLNVALHYKASKAQDNVDWESCQIKYVDMLARFLEQYPSETNEDFPHVKEEITQGR